jgi:hypothetical protein
LRNSTEQERLFNISVLNKEKYHAGEKNEEKITTNFLNIKARRMIFN